MSSQNFWNSSINKNGLSSQKKNLDLKPVLTKTLVKPSHNNKFLFEKYLYDIEKLFCANKDYFSKICGAYHADITINKLTNKKNNDTKKNNKLQKSYLMGPDIFIQLYFENKNDIKQNIKSICGITIKNIILNDLYTNI